MLLTRLALYATGLLVSVQFAALAFVPLTGCQHFMRSNARQHCVLAFCPSAIAHHQQLRHSMHFLTSEQLVCSQPVRSEAKMHGSGLDCEQMCACVRTCLCVTFAISQFKVHPMALQAGRLKVVESHASVYVRVCDAQRMGSVEGPANEAGAQPFLREPSYVQEGSRVQYDMQTVKTGGRTYDNAR